VREPISQAKLVGLRQVLERDGAAQFHRGSVVEIVDCTGCKGRGQVPEGGRLPHEDVTWLRCERCKGECSVLRVTGPMGGITHYALEDIRHAYDLALNGPRPKAQPKGDPGDYGDEAPF
jgi:hypothetical protein